MGKLKKWAAPLAVFGVLVAGAGTLTFVNLSQAQTTAAAGATAGAGHKFGGRRGMMPGVFGTVATVSGNTITLTGKNGTTYTVDASAATINKFANNVKTTITVLGIQTGDSLGVSGTVTGNNVAAKNIMDGMPTRQAPTASGTVASISGNIITLTGSNGTPYTVDATSAGFNINKSAVSLENSGITTGDKITVFGTLTGTNIVATKIMDGNMMGKGPGMLGKPIIGQ